MDKANYNTRLGALQDLSEDFTAELEYLEKKANKEKAEVEVLREVYFENMLDYEAKAKYEFAKDQYRLTDTRHYTMKVVVNNINSRIKAHEELNQS